MLTGSEEKRREKEHLVNITLKLVMLKDEIVVKDYMMGLKKLLSTDAQIQAYCSLLEGGTFQRRKDLAGYLRQHAHNLKTQQNRIEGKDGIITSLLKAGYIYKRPTTNRGKLTHKTEYVVSYPYPHLEIESKMIEIKNGLPTGKENLVHWSTDELKHRDVLPKVRTKLQALGIMKSYLGSPQPHDWELGVLEHHKDITLKKITRKSAKELKELIPLLLDSIGLNLDIDDLMILLSLELKQKIKDKEAMRKWKQKALRT